jgi:hypothetical protein
VQVSLGFEGDESVREKKFPKKVRRLWINPFGESALMKISVTNC